MADPRTYHFTLPKSRRPSEVTLVEPWYPGVQPHWPNCTTRRSVDPIMGGTGMNVNFVTFVRASDVDAGAKGVAS